MRVEIWGRDKTYNVELEWHGDTSKNASFGIMTAKAVAGAVDDQSELLEERRLNDLVNVHPEFIGFPVELYVEKSDESADVAESDEAESESDLSDDEIEDKYAHVFRQGVYKTRSKRELESWRTSMLDQINSVVPKAHRQIALDAMSRVYRTIHFDARGRGLLVE